MNLLAKIQNIFTENVPFKALYQIAQKDLLHGMKWSAWAISWNISSWDADPNLK